MSEIDFAKRMRLVPDEELITIISCDGFVPAAVAVARTEIDRRNLGSEVETRLAAEAQQLQRFKGDRASVPLSGAGKVAFFVFSPLLLWVIIVVLVLSARGYGRKSADGLKWAGMGLVSWVALGIVLAIVT